MPDKPQTKADLVRRQMQLEDDIRQLDAKIASAASQVRIATLAFFVGAVVFVFFHWMIGGFILVVSLLTYFTQKGNVSHYTKYREAAHNDLISVRVEAA